MKSDMSASSSYETQYSNASAQSNDSEASLSLSSSTTVQYEPIQVSLYRKQTPTIATGRRSKHFILVGVEAARREKRRARNREAARKLKEKRKCIEDELLLKHEELQSEHVNLQNYIKQLQQKKQNLQQEIDNSFMDSLQELLSNDNEDLNLFFEQYLHDLTLFKEPIENILNWNLNIDADSMIDN
ncbi:unnamed protein product [Rotaria socialis]|uniref:BZIP domain-containing protein n=2 Tax=Rotaria socialis TaxID=392032 RepID=A0A818EVR0_9BILA|nr:unnamed protein product [Rotaria socialis]CAF3399120.1 unnamed protein product [Rotaria socialis]CAF3465504.1 unnamed protein product [Rotaria socialis]CAF4653444.1 unnamed protein product [Rotaria socialis]CAF4874129.1 unnamed protein product [Rotaria socialis]